MDNFKITKTILENINEQNDRINECVDIVNGYTTDEETRVNQELQRQENELRREEQYNNNENRFTLINEQLETKVNKTETQGIQQQVNNLVLGAVGDGNNAEVIQARGYNNTLNERLDTIENVSGISYYKDKFFNDNFSQNGALNESIWCLDKKFSYEINAINISSVNDCNGKVLLLQDVNNVRKVVFEKEVSLTIGNNTINIGGNGYTNCYLAFNFNKQTIPYSVETGNQVHLSTLILNELGESTISGVGDFQIKIEVTTLKINKNNSVILNNIVKNNRTITVDKNGNGDFTTINQALKYAYRLESVLNPIDIIINEGVYNEVLFIQGKHNVNLIGVDKDTCIIRDDSGEYNNAPVRIEGNSLVKNLTIIATHDNDPTYATRERNPLVWNDTVGSYAIHIDDKHNDDVSKYICTVENCNLISNQMASVGLGLQKNQVVELINCNIEKNIPSTLYNNVNYNGKYGALFFHNVDGSIYTGGVGTQNLVVKNCKVKTNLGQAMSNQNLGTGGELTFQENTFLTDDNTITDVIDVGSFTITEDSFGNNISKLNKS